jgi:hypothetical protein
MEGGVGLLELLFVPLRPEMTCFVETLSSQVVVCDVSTRLSHNPLEFGGSMLQSCKHPGVCRNCQAVPDLTTRHLNVQ